MDLNSSNRGCTRLGGEVDPPLGVVVEEVAVLVVLVRRHRRAVRAAVRRAVDDEVPGAVEEETGPAAVRRVPCAPRPLSYLCSKDEEPNSTSNMRSATRGLARALILRSSG